MSQKKLALCILVTFLICGQVYIVVRPTMSTGMFLLRSQTEILVQNNATTATTTNKACRPKNDQLIESNAKLKLEKEELAEKLEKMERRMRQMERQSTLRTFCQRQYMKNKVENIIKENFLYNKKYNFMYCSVPKTGCTNWKRIMLVLSGRFNATTELNNKDKVHDYPIPQLRRLKGKDFDQVKNSFYSFFFVRDPFERILASYRNKLHNVLTYSRSFQRRVGSEILKLYRSNLTAAEYKKGQNVTFKEFVDFIIHKTNESGIQVLDEHWQLMHRISNVCSFKYDYIGKMETLVEDSEQILQDLNLADDISFPVNLTDRYESIDKRVMLKYYSTIPKNTLIKLYEIYKDDFDAFGYEKPDYIFA